jgi:1-acyl-sn-glycerol-3-phosphate acyltransferase
MQILDFVFGHLYYLLWLFWIVHKWWFILSVVVFVFLVAMCKVADPLSPFTYKAKLVFLCYSTMMGTSLLWPMFALRPFDLANTKISGALVRKAAYFVNMTFEVRGIDILERDAKVVIVANHQLALDTFCEYN